MGHNFLKWSRGAAFALVFRQVSPHGLWWGGGGADQVNDLVHYKLKKEKKNLNFLCFFHLQVEIAIGISEQLD